jgi:hypothetical protein
MDFLKMLKFLVIYSFIKLFVLSEFTSPEDEGSVNDVEDDENLVLDSVYDTMKNNYEQKLQYNLDRLNFISDIRNKRNINEPINNYNTMSNGFNPINSLDVYKNHQYEVNRKNPVNFPLGFKSPVRPLPMSGPLNPVHRSDYEYEE